MPSMLHMLQFVLHIWNTLLLAVEEIPTLQLLVCWLGGYGGWKSMVLVWRRRRWVEWLQSGGPWLHRAQTWVWMPISTVSWEENAISIHNERGTGSWTWLQHNYIEKKCTSTTCVLLQLWNQAFNMDGMGTWGRKLLALHQLNQACTLYTLELYPELLLPLVAFTLLAHSISSFAAFWMAIIFGVHTTVCVPLLLDPLISPVFANGYMIFSFLHWNTLQNPWEACCKCCTKALCRSW